jgi:hypothetical protein
VNETVVVAMVMHVVSGERNVIMTEVMTVTGYKEYFV